MFDIRTKQFELYSNACCTEYNILCLTETWLNDSCLDHNLFPDSYTVLRSDQVSANKTRAVECLLNSLPVFALLNVGTI
jgi:hypothetical protein